MHKIKTIIKTDDKITPTRYNVQYFVIIFCLFAKKKSYAMKYFDEIV